MGFKPKNTIYHQTVDIVIANSLTLAVVQITKNLVKKKGRMAQIILVSHQVIQPLPSPMPYSFKNTKILTCGMPVVGLYLQQPPILRIANNKHYSSDVLAGQGGLLSGILVTNYNPFQAIKFGRKNRTSAFIYPQFGQTNGLGSL
jgi:hypothetical protein